jgi:hypothetical protein
MSGNFDPGYAICKYIVFIGVFIGLSQIGKKQWPHDWQKMVAKNVIFIEKS